MKKKATKTPLSRLLDLTAGWSELVQGEHNVYDDTVSGDELRGLYQETADILSERLTPEEEIVRVRRFVDERILPILLREPISVPKTKRSNGHLPHKHSLET